MTFSESLPKYDLANIMASLLRNFVNIFPSTGNRTFLEKDLGFRFFPRGGSLQGGTGWNSVNPLIPSPFLAFFRHKMLRNAVPFLPVAPS